MRGVDMKGNNMITREEAMVKRIKMYTDCAPCFREHPPCRYTKTGKCVYCHRERAAKDKLSIKTKNSIRRKYGLVQVVEFVPLQDVEAFRAYCMSLRFDRGIPEMD
jgi:hypothetical protein